MAGVRVDETHEFFIVLRDHAWGGRSLMVLCRHCVCHGGLSDLRPNELVLLRVWMRHWGTLDALNHIASH